MPSATNAEFCDYITSIYYEHKQNKRVINFIVYLKTAEVEYRTLYRTESWAASKNDPASDFYNNNTPNDEKLQAVECMAGVVGVVVKVAEVAEVAKEVKEEETGGQCRKNRT